MFKKTFLVSTAVLLLCFVTSCSLINSSDESGSVKLTIPARSIKGLSESDYENLLIDVSLKGDYSQSITISAKSDATANFENLKIGANVYIEANAYTNKLDQDKRDILFTGTSDTFKIHAGVQEVSLTLKKIYKVSFDPNGGTGTYEDQRIISGEKATKPEDPVRESEDEDSTYVFAGWYESLESADEKITLSETPFDFSTSIKKDLKLYAKWDIKQLFTVTFDANNGTGEIIDTVKVSDGYKVSAPEKNPTKEANEEQGFEFAGWFTSDDEGKSLSTEPFDFDTAITGNLTLYAGWNPIPYVTVTFDVNGGTGEYEAQRVLQGQTINRPGTNPKKESDDENTTYSFVNWFTSPDGGKTFDSKPFDFSKPVTEDMVLYAVWTTEKVYTVTFNLNGGDGTDFEENVIVGEKLSEPTITPERESDDDHDYEFAGWFTSSDEGKTLSSTPFNFNNEITENITLYAGWIITNYYHVTFIVNGGKENITSQRIKENSKAQKPKNNPTKDPAENTSYNFAGWFTSSDEGKTLASTPFDFNTPITENITLYAKWDVEVTSYIDVEIPLDTVTNVLLIISSRGLEGGIRELTAKEGYDTYIWKWDGVIQTEYTNQNVFITPTAVIGGTYTVTLLVSKTEDGVTKYYSETMQVTRQQ